MIKKVCPKVLKMAEIATMIEEKAGKALVSLAEKWPKVIVQDWIRKESNEEEERALQTDRSVLLSKGDKRLTEI